MGVGGRKFVGAGAKVCCGRGLRIGAGGRKYTHTCTKVRNIGAKVRCGGCVGVVGSGQGCGAVAVQVRTYVGGVRSGGAEGCRRAWAGSLYSGVLLPLHQVAISGKERI